jgi:predicted RNA-binding Zn-ribbon protein involved in translation (DUF1610 family)
MSAEFKCPECGCEWEPEDGSPDVCPECGFDGMSEEDDDLNMCIMCHCDYKDTGFHEYSDRYCPRCAEVRDERMADLERMKEEHREEIEAYKNGTGPFPDFASWRK